MVAAQRQVVERLHHGNRPQEIEQARAQAAAQESIVERLHNGSRPEEIAQAKANVVAAQAEAANARLRYNRLERLSSVRLPDQSQVQAVSQEDLDDAKAALDEAEAKLTVNQKALELAVLGPRREDIAEGEARLRLNRKALELAVEGPRKEDIAAGRGPAEGQRGATGVSQAATGRHRSSRRRPTPSSARGCSSRGRCPRRSGRSSRWRSSTPSGFAPMSSETELGKVRPGMAASVVVDTFPNRRFEGWIGFISPVAEFTPKAVQTEELRTSLVYEVRVFVKDPDDELRLGMPATVTFPLGPAG